MKFVLKLGDKQIFYDESHVFIDGTKCASYNSNEVIWLSTSSLLAKFNHYSDHSWLLYDGGILEAHNRDRILRNQSYNKILGTYTGTHSGALASYIAYKHSLTTPSTKQNTSVTPKKSQEQTPVSQSSETVQHLQNVQNKVEPKPEPKYTPPKQELSRIEKIYEEPPIYEPPKQDYEYKELDFTPPPTPIPSGSSESSGGCLGFIIAIITIIIAIKLIPQSWKDLPTFMAEGDIGIIISFFSSLIGGVLAIFRCLYDKESKISSALSTFLITCGIGIAINVFILFKDIFAGDYEFTGFILFDLPLAVFAPILGCFQFAFPIGIGVIIICGIICLVKKNS